MAVNSISGANGSMQAGHSGMGMPTDSVSKNIQRQIESARKQLQELSSNEDMPLEEKMKKRQEIQNEIVSLNQQLRQHQMEQRKARQTEGSSIDDMLGDRRDTDTAQADKGGGLSQAGMQSLILAGSSLKQAQVQGSVATKMEGRAGVLKAEIKQDAGRGNVEAKKEELADIEKKAWQAVSGQMSVLGKANQEIKEAAEADSNKKDSEKEAEEPDKEAVQSSEAGQPAFSPENYVSVDIRL